MLSLFKMTDIKAERQITLTVLSYQFSVYIHFSCQKTAHKSKPNDGFVFYFFNFKIPFVPYISPIIFQICAHFVIAIRQLDDFITASYAVGGAFFVMDRKFVSAVQWLSMAGKAVYYALIGKTLVQ